MQFTFYFLDPYEADGMLLFGLVDWSNDFSQGCRWYLESEVVGVDQGLFLHSICGSHSRGVYHHPSYEQQQPVKPSSEIPGLIILKKKKFKIKKI